MKQKINKRFVRYQEKKTRVVCGIVHRTTFLNLKKTLEMLPWMTKKEYIRCVSIQLMLAYSSFQLKMTR